MPDHGEAMRALVKAFNDGAVYCGMYHELGSDRAECVDCMGPAIAAVLLAADTAEPVGAWKVMGGNESTSVYSVTGGCCVGRDLGRGLTEIVAEGLDREKARAVANTLNRLEAR